MKMIDWTKPIRFTGDGGAVAHHVGVNPYATNSCTHLVINIYQVMMWVSDYGLTLQGAHVVENTPPPKKTLTVYGIVVSDGRPGSISVYSYVNKAERERFISNPNGRIVLRVYEHVVEYEDKS